MKTFLEYLKIILLPTKDDLTTKRYLPIPFPKPQTFFGIFWVLPIDYSLYKKEMLRIFFYLFISKVLNLLVEFTFLQTVQSRCNTSYLGTSHFCAKYIYRFLALIYLYTLKEIPCKKLCKVLEMEIKTYTPNFVFERIKFKTLH